MGNIQDYIFWLGNKTFDEVPFNETDAMVFSELSYLDMKEALEALPGASLSQVCAYLEGKKQLTAKTSTRTRDYDKFSAFYRTAGLSKRFGGTLITDFEDTIDNKTQFCAMRFVPDCKDRFSFIAFRGTDDSITGWKEDFVETFTKTYAQEHSVDYLRALIEKLPEDEKIYVGGHSKGGNLAKYGTASLSMDKIKRIEHIYCHDGPGFSPDVYDLSILEKIKDRLSEYTPKFCLIAKLFRKELKDCRIVEAAGQGFAQHELLSWNIGPDGPVFVEATDPDSDRISEVLYDWMFDADPEKRHNFVDTFFDSLRVGGTETFDENGVGGAKQIEAVLMQIVRDPEAMKFAAAFPRQALFRRSKSLKETLRSNIGHKKTQFLVALFQIVAGILFIVIPENGLEILTAFVVLVPVAYEVILTLTCLKKNGWNLKTERLRVTICILMLAFYLVIILKEGVLSMVSSIIIGAILFVMAYSSISDIKTYKGRYVRIALCWIEALAFAALGIIAFVVSGSSLGWYAVYLGIVILADGAYKLLMAAFARD